MDVTLKVKERGKNSVQLSGGVSGIAGSFVSFGYSTNNFLGLGETLSLDSQVPNALPVAKVMPPNSAPTAELAPPSSATRP